MQPIELCSSEDFYEFDDKEFEDDELHVPPHRKDMDDFDITLRKMACDDFDEEWLEDHDIFRIGID